MTSKKMYDTWIILKDLDLKNAAMKWHLETAMAKVHFI